MITVAEAAEMAAQPEQVTSIRHTELTAKDILKAYESSVYLS